MISIFVLTILAAGFAYSMKVETRLAQHANNESQLQWLGRSGVEWARWILAEQAKIAAEPYDSRDQVWAGGPGGVGTSNSPLANLPDELILGKGVVKRPRITDLESRWNINMANEEVLKQALINMGVDAGSTTPTMNSILDWIDNDGNTRPQGAEDEAYRDHGAGLAGAKNAFIDDISELLFIIPSDLYYGISATNIQEGAFLRRMNKFGDNRKIPMETPGFSTLFSPMGSARININTASAAVLQCIPGLDETIAQTIVSVRSGMDDGSGLSGPFRNLTPNYLWTRVQGIPLEMGRRIQTFCDVRSRTFEVEVDVNIGGSSRTFYAVLGRNNPRDVQVLSFYWKD